MLGAIKYWQTVGSRFLEFWTQGILVGAERRKMKNGLAIT